MKPPVFKNESEKLQSRFQSEADPVENYMSDSGPMDFQVYHEMNDVPVSLKSLEQEFLSRLAMVEDLQKRFRFMMTELKSVGLRTED